MKPIVMKFGGTSVGSPEAIIRSARLVSKEVFHNPIVVVVSALSGVTNQLLSMVRSAAYGDWLGVDQRIRDLDLRHRIFITTLGLDALTEQELLREMDFRLADLRSTLFETRNNGGPGISGPAFFAFQDAVASLGERLCAPIFAALLGQREINSIYIDSSKLIFTDDRFSQANVLFEVTNLAIKKTLNPLLSNNIVPVVTGFIGSTLQGALTTLGRGASDYTSTIIGAAINAAEIWNWTDVDGVLSADPRLAPRARLIHELSYSEMALLSACGAKVLHPDTVQPVARLGIPLHVRNSFRPDRPGTMVQKEQPTRDHRPYAVVNRGGYEINPYQSRSTWDALPGVNGNCSWIDNAGNPTWLIKREPINHQPAVSIITILGGKGASPSISSALEYLPLTILARSSESPDGCLQAAVWEKDAPKAVEWLHDTLVVS